MSAVHKELESQLKDKVPEDPMLLQTMKKQQEEEMLLDSQQTAVREQQQEAQELLVDGLDMFASRKGAKFLFECTH